MYKSGEARDFHKSHTIMTVMDTPTHTNVVLRGVGTKPELNDTENMLCRKRRDLMWLTRCPHAGDGYSKSLWTALIRLK